MELRPDASYKENVPPRPATSLRPEPWRLRKSLGVGLGSRHGRWVPMGPAERAGPAATPCLGTALCQEPCQVQSNLTSRSPSPSLGLILRDTTGRLTNSSFRQQVNLQSLVGRPQGTAKDFAIQQSNLCARETHTAECGHLTSPQLWSEPQESFSPHLMPQGSPLPRGPLAHPSSNLRRSWLLATDTSCPDIKLTTGLAPLKGPTWSDPRSQCGLGGWTSRLVEEPLTLKDLAVPAQIAPRAPSQAAIHQLLVCVQRLEREAVRLRCQASREPPGPVRQELWTRAGQTLPVCSRPCQPVLDSWDERRRHSRGLRGTSGFPETQGAQEGLSDSQASSKRASLRTTLEMLPGDALDPEQVVLSACPLSSARGILPGQEGGNRAPRERISREKESCQWLSRCFRGWWRWAQRQRAVAAAVALGRRQLLRRGLRALRWGLWLREAQLDAAWERHTQALLARTFQKWRHLIQQHKQGQPHVQAGPRPLSSGGDQDQGPSGRKPVVDGCHRAREGISFYLGNFTLSPGSLREEAGAQPILLRSGLRPDGGERGVPILQALQHLAVFLLWCHQKEWARQEKGVQGEASQATLRTQRMGRPPHTWRSPAAGAAWVALLDPQHRRAWLCRCFGAWQRFVQRGTRYRDHVANCQAGTLRTCLQQWMQMKQLRASDGAKVAQLSLCWQKAGNMALFSSVPGGATAHGLRLMVAARVLPQEQGQGSLQEACRKLALQRVLLLWRTRLSQRQRADSFFKGVQWRALRHILRGWRLRAQDPGSTRIASAPDPPPGHSTHRRSSRDEASRAPALLEMLQLSFLWAAGQRQQGRCLLLWRARAQQSRDAARWHQSTLQRRILLDWSHWATAQGAQRELAARWAWDRRGRAALGLWRQRLVQQREVELRARERGRRLQRRALGHWHCYWQRQAFLQEKCQRWVQARLQGLRRAMFWGWQQAAARRRPVVASPEQLLLQSHFQAWCRVVKASWAKHPAFQDDLSRRIPRATFASEAPAATAQPWELRVAQASCWRSREQRCQADRQLRRTWAQQAFVARRVAPGLCRTARRQAGESSRAQAFCWMLWARESCQHQVIRDHAVPTLSARWVPSTGPRDLDPISDSGPCPANCSHPLPAGWAQALLANPLGPVADSAVQSVARTTGGGPEGQQSPPGQAQGQPPALAWDGHQRAPPGADEPSSPEDPDLQLQAMGHGTQPNPAPQPQWTDAGRSVLGSDSTSRSIGAVTASLPSAPPPSSSCRGPGPAAPAAELPAGQPPGSHVAALGRCSGGGEAGADSAQAVAPEMGLATVAVARPAVAGGSAVTESGGQPGPFPDHMYPEPGLLAWGRGKGPRFPQGQKDLGPAFKKWHQCLAARALRTRASSSMRPWSKAGLRRPGSRLETARAPALGGPGAEKGAQLQL
ncbi:uncharacterized protein C1orf167 homolog [Bos mutus]|uniref:uncharacterized protein C1orf167 homolog n=1 Tax=Bos mutus TaxID=72004 RepID=UPI0038B52056